MKTLLWVTGLSLALLGASSCGDDSDEKKPDQGLQLQDGSQTDVGVQPDAGVSVPDVGVQPDTGTPQTGPNSGQTCDQTTTCPAGDECLALQGWSKGMCFGPCAKQGDTCPTADATKHFSTCALTDANQSKWYCLYICEASGQTYECPDPATQECVASSTSGVKICKPRSTAPPPDSGAPPADAGLPPDLSAAPDAGVKGVGTTVAECQGSTALVTTFTGNPKVKSGFAIKAKAGGVEVYGYSWSPLVTYKYGGKPGAIKVRLILGSQIGTNRYQGMMGVFEWSTSQGKWVNLAPPSSTVTVTIAAYNPVANPGGLMCNGHIIGSAEGLFNAKDLVKFVFDVPLITPLFPGVSAGGPP
jgi:hypothetical protein